MHLSNYERFASTVRFCTELYSTESCCDRCLGMQLDVEVVAEVGVEVEDQLHGKQTESC